MPGGWGWGWHSSGFGAAVAWTPALATTSGGVLPHTWHYAGSGALFQDSALTTPAASDGDPIGGSTNQGSDAHSIVQATAGARPTLKLAILNGHPVYRFDGGDLLQGAFGGGGLSIPATFFCVTQLAAGQVNDNARHNVIDGDDGTNRFVFRQEKGPTPDQWAMGAASLIYNGNSDGNWSIFCGISNGASSSLWVDGGSVSSGNIGNTNPDGLTVGGSYTATELWTGDVGEVLIYNAGLSTADLNEIGAYLATKFGASWSTVT